MTRTKTISYDKRARVFLILTGIFLLSICTYIYAINVTARHIAERQELEREIVSLGADLSSLEFAYIELKNSITLEKASELGFKEVRGPLFVSRAQSVSLTLNTEVDR